MKIIVLDGYTENPGDLSWEGLEALGDLRVYDRTSVTDVEEIVERIGDGEIIFTNKTPISAQVMEQCPGIRYIGVLATGFNVVDCQEAKRRGIPVCNIPSYGTDAVAQFTIALLLEICHHIGHHSQAVREGRWSQNPDWCFWDYPLIELSGKTMGIIGYGRIGQKTAEIAQALGMKVLAYDVRGRERLAGPGCGFAELPELYEASDVIVLHCPATRENEGMINKDSLSKMKDGVILINDSRGQLIVEEDLKSALDSGKVAAAGLDVVGVEPIREDNPLLHAANCIITPHIAWAPRESRKRLLDAAVSNLKAFMDGNPVNVVNP